MVNGGGVDSAACASIISGALIFGLQDADREARGRPRRKEPKVTMNVSGDSAAGVPSRIAARPARFIVVGALNTAFGYGVFYIVLRLGGHALTAVAVSTLVGATFNFFTIGSLVFGSAERGRFARFIVVYAIVFVVNCASMAALEGFSLAPALVQALMLPELAALSYILNRDFVFARRSNAR